MLLKRLSARYHRMRSVATVVFVVYIMCIDLVLCKDSCIYTPRSFLTNYITYQKACQAMGYIKNTCEEDNGVCTHCIDVTTKIAFHARLAKNLKNLGKLQPVIFPTVTINKGGAYDSSTGKFTAPRDGVYSFDWTILSCGKNKEFYTQLVNNSTIIAYNFCNGAFSYPCSQSAVVEMKTGNKVWIRTHSSGTCAGVLWSSFSGFSL